MYAVIDAEGRVLACGETRSLVAPAGGQVVETATDPLAAVGMDQEAYWDGATFAVRARVLGAAEQAHRADVAGLKQYQGLASPTLAQTVAATKAQNRILARIIAELRD